MHDHVVAQLVAQVPVARSIVCKVSAQNVLTVSAARMATTKVGDETNQHMDERIPTQQAKLLRTLSLG